MRNQPPSSHFPRFPPLEVFRRRPPMRAAPSVSGRHPKTFTGGDIILWYGYMPLAASYRASWLAWHSRDIPNSSRCQMIRIPPCLIGIEARVGAHHLSRKLTSLGHDARLMPAKYVRPYLRGQKNDFRDAEAFRHELHRRALHRLGACRRIAKSLCPQEHIGSLRRECGCRIRSDARLGSADGQG